MTQPVSFWTEEKVAKLREIAADKTRSTREMGEILGCTRNAVVGKCRRLGIALNAPSYPIKRVDGEPRLQPAKWVPKRVHAVNTKIELDPEPSSRTWIRFWKLREYSCRWPVKGEPSHEMLCCGARRRVNEEGKYDSPYCAFHHDLGHTGFGRAV